MATAAQHETPSATRVLEYFTDNDSQNEENEEEEEEEEK
uniref:Uncharacterized protein n=1 Tax=Rhizophora mucronata TaxID=61149 RepID=A0A2P2MC78_RHIMU